MVLDQRYETTCKTISYTQILCKKKNLAKIPRVNHVQRVPKKNCFTLSRHQIQNYKSGRKERKKEEEIEANLVILGKRNSDSSTAKDGA